MYGLTLTILGIAAIAYLSGFWDAGFVFTMLALVPAFIAIDQEE